MWSDKFDPRAQTVAPAPIKEHVATFLPFVSPLEVNESTYTYSPSDAVTVRAPHGIDLRAGYKPWPGGPRGVLSVAMFGVYIFITIAICVVSRFI